MGACDTWNVEINILVYENEMFPLPAEFQFCPYILVFGQVKAFLSMFNISFINSGL